MSYRQNISEKGNELKICAANGEGKVMKKFTVYHVKTNNSIVFYLFKATILFTLLVVSLIQPFAATGGTIPNGEICLCLIASQLKDKQQNNARIFLPSCALDREKQYILYNSHVEEKTLPLETAAPPSKHNFQNAHFHIHTIIAQGNGKFVEFTSKENMVVVSNTEISSQVCRDEEIDALSFYFPPEEAAVATILNCEKMQPLIQLLPQININISTRTYLNSGEELFRVFSFDGTRVKIRCNKDVTDELVSKSEKNKKSLFLSF